MAGVGVFGDEDPAETGRQSASTAMALLGMFQRQTFALLPPAEVEACHGTVQEQALIEECTDRTLHRTVAQVAGWDEVAQEEPRFLAENIAK